MDERNATSEKPSKPSSVSYRILPGHPGYRVGDDGSVWSRKARGFVPRGERWRSGEGWHRLRIMYCKHGRGRLKIDGVMFTVGDLVEIAFSDDEVVKANFALEKPPTPAELKERLAVRTRVERELAMRQDLINAMDSLSPALIAQIKEDLKSGTMGKFAVAHKYKLPMTVMYAITRKQ